MKNPLFEKLFKKNQNSERAFLFFEEEKFLTFSEYVGMIPEFSSSLRGVGLKPGDRVALKIEKSHYFLAVYGACIHRGLIFLPVTDNSTTAALLFCLKA